MSHLLPKSESPLRRHRLLFGVSLHRRQGKQVADCTRVTQPGMPCFLVGLGTAGTFKLGKVQLLSVGLDAHSLSRL